LQKFAFVFGQMSEHPFVDPIGEQQHFDTLLAEDFQCGLFFAAVKLRR